MASVSQQLIIAAGGRSKVVIIIPHLATDYNLFLNRGPNYQEGNTDITFLVEAGSSIYGTVAGGAAITAGTGWSLQDTITLINHGEIIGNGGDGGKGAGNGASNFNSPGAVGLAGGTAIIADWPLAVDNQGIIGGGGGGGAGGGTGAIGSGGGGGGGGRGGTPTPAGARGVGYNALNGVAGVDGIYASGGKGGNGYSGTVGAAGKDIGDAANGSSAGAGTTAGGGGGGGGGLGGKGGNGGKGGFSGQAAGALGGAAGACNTGTITWINTGTRYGAYT